MQFERSWRSREGAEGKGIAVDDRSSDVATSSASGSGGSESEGQDDARAAMGPASEGGSSLRRRVQRMERDAVMKDRLFLATLDAIAQLQRTWLAQLDEAEQRCRDEVVASETAAFASLQDIHRAVAMIVSLVTSEAKTAATAAAGRRRSATPPEVHLHRGNEDVADAAAAAGHDASSPAGHPIWFTSEGAPPAGPGPAWTYAELLDVVETLSAHNRLLTQSLLHADPFGGAVGSADPPLAPPPPASMVSHHPNLTRTPGAIREPTDAWPRTR